MARTEKVIMKNMCMVFSENILNRSEDEFSFDYD